MCTEEVCSLGTLGTLGQRRTARGEVAKANREGPKGPSTAVCTSRESLRPRATCSNLQGKMVSVAAWQKMDQGQEWKRDELKDHMRAQ